jgi:hypothetical protein
MYTSFKFTPCDSGFLPDKSALPHSIRAKFKSAPRRCSSRFQTTRPDIDYSPINILPFGRNYYHDITITQRKTLIQDASLHAYSGSRLSKLALQ